MRKINLALTMATICCGAGMLYAAQAPRLMNQPDAWFKSDEGRRVVDNILTWQGKGIGGVQAWPKAYDANILRPPDGGGLEWGGIATIDNGATHSELYILARAITLETPGPRQDMIKAAFDKGLDAVLSQQYDNGGWPQRFPIGQPKQAAYYTHITFNDDAMTRLLERLKQVAEGKEPYAFVDVVRKNKAQAAYQKGLDCILKCQIVVNGKLTGWCAQHDEKTLKPAGARVFELAGLSGSEGAGLAIFLMHVEKPDDRVKKAVIGAAEWFDAVKILPEQAMSATGPAANATATMISSAAQMAAAPGRGRGAGGVRWARFYDLETMRPFFAGRDGVKKFKLEEIDAERQRGYAWYGTWGIKVLTEYATWKTHNGIQ